MKEMAQKRHLNEVGLKYKKVMTKPLLTLQTIKNRLKFCKIHLANDTDWIKMIFVDECTF